MKYRLKNTKITVLVIAIYQIIGGVAGIGLIAWLLLKTQTINGALLLIFLTAVGLYLLSIKAGMYLLEKNYKKGLIYSIIIQAFQVVAIGLGSHKYDFYSGSKANIGVNFTDGFNLKFDFGLTSQFNFAINSSDKEYFLYINIVAIFLIYVLSDLYNEIVSRKIIIEETVSDFSENILENIE